MKPNIVGSKVLYLNPSQETLASADIAAIDEGIAYQTISPYAYTSTVRDDYDSVSIYFPGSDLVTVKQFAVGLFLSPDNDKHNLLFQVSGRASLSVTGTNISTRGHFFFGRKATNNTVTSSKAATSNTLDKFIYLPCRHKTAPSLVASAAGGSPLDESIVDEVFALESAGAYVWCFGYQLANQGANTDTLKGLISLSFRKYSTGLSAFKPSYV